MGDVLPDRMTDEGGGDDDEVVDDNPVAEDRESAEDEDDDEGAGHVLPDEVEYPDTGDDPATALLRRAERWRRRSAAGAMLTGFAFGLREALEPNYNQPAIVLETSGTPPKDLPVEADIDNVPPRQSVVRVRRWLLTDTPGGVPDDPAGAGANGETAAGATRPATEIRSREIPRTRRFGRRRGTRR